MTRHSFQAACPRHAEDLLARELRACGAQDIGERPVSLSFTGTLETAYRACLWSRVASRVLLPLKEFQAATPEELREGVKGIDWTEHMSVDTTFVVSATVSQSVIDHSQYASQLVKDGVADFFRERQGNRPSVDRVRPGIRLHLHLFRDTATLSLNLSGESLHRRGYRVGQGPAPLKENVAAVLLMRGLWHRIAAETAVFLDPMCGSGTIPIEAALMALDVAPGLMRGRFGFEAWLQHDVPLWRRLTTEAQERRRRARSAPIVGYDASPMAVQTAQANAREAGLADAVRFEIRDLASCVPPPGRAGLVAVNPPYGERMGTVEELEPLYRDLGRVLRDRFPSWRVALLTSSPDLSFATGLKAYRVNKLYNGPIPCEIALFTIRPLDPDRPFTRPVESVPAPRAEPAAPRRVVVRRRAAAGSAAPPTTPAAATPAEGARSEAFDFSQRLKRNIRLMRKWAQAEGVSCYRIYDTDLPQFAVAIDLYEGTWAHVQEYAPPAEIEPERAARRLADVVAAIPEILEIPPANVFVKERRRQRGPKRYQKLAETGERHEVQEGGLRFLVNFTDYLDTGLFLDHRPTRAMISEMSRGRAFLNLFCYTGSATAYAAHGGATRSVSVDTSRTYLDWARANMERNGLAAPQHEYVRQDAREFLRSDAERNQGLYGLVFIDPPTYSNTNGEREDFSVQEDHVALIRGAESLLEPGGVIVFSSNFRKLELDTAGLAGLEVTDISSRTIPRDFSRNPRIHRCWLIRK
jgi:23S rRNA (guanine2445-N2)-methyltransferase / 23S rRNA (guanine2069-N7)-methyltransferase